MTGTCLTVLFPGQGSQKKGMGKELYDSFSWVRDLFQEASDICHQNIASLCFDADENILSQTQNTQPALFTVSVACFRLLEKELGIKPYFCAGHSLGEYSALVAAQSISFDQGIKWVWNRGNAMAHAVPVGLGGMMAVLGLSDDQVRDLCLQVTESLSEKNLKNSSSPSFISCIQPANFNSAGQVVVAGSQEALKEFRLLSGTLSVERMKIIPLSVSGPFHCSLMKPAREKMALLFEMGEEKKVNDPHIPYVPNVTGQVSVTKDLILEHLLQQIDHPVLWRQSMEHLFDLGMRETIECGPGNILSTLARRIQPADGQKRSFLSCYDIASFKEVEKKLNNRGLPEEKKEFVL